MYIEASKFLDTMTTIRSWMSLGGKSEKLEKSTKDEFGELKKEAGRTLDKREGLLWELGFCFFVLCAVFIAVYQVMHLVDTTGHLSHFFLILIGTVVVGVLVLARWIKILKDEPKVKLDDYQEMIYDDIVYLLRSPWMKYLDWTVSKEDAQLAWHKVLRNMAGEIKGLEHKLTLLDYPEKLDDEESLHELRQALSEHLRILRRFKIVNVEKSDLFEPTKV